MAAVSRRRLQAGAIALASLPLLVLGGRAASVGLGANPIEAITHTTGEWSLRFLLLALAVTPAQLTQIRTAMGLK